MKKLPPSSTDLPALIDRIEHRIVVIRGLKVMLDSDLAELYEVEVRALNQAVKRNIERFPEDFMFQLTWEEARQRLRSQNVTLNRGQHRKYTPYAFTELGVAMLSSVLKSERAIRANIAIMRAFVRLRSILAAHKELDRRLTELEKKTDLNFRAVFELIEQLLIQEEQERRRIGFSSDRQ